MTKPPRQELPRAEIVGGRQRRNIEAAVSIACGVGAVLLVLGLLYLIR